MNGMQTQSRAMLFPDTDRACRECGGKGMVREYGRDGRYCSQPCDTCAGSGLNGIVVIGGAA